MKAYKHNLSELKYIQPDNAVTDARRAIANNDSRFIGFSGGEFFIPGLKGDAWNNAFVTRVGYKKVVENLDDGHISVESIDLLHNSECVSFRPERSVAEKSLDVTKRQDFSATLEMTPSCFYSFARNFDFCKRSIEYARRYNVCILQHVKLAHKVSSK